MEFRIHNLKNFNGQQKEKIISALTKGCPLIDLPVWENRILKLKMTETKGYSNKEIIEIIRSGKDGRDGENDKIIDIDMEGVFLNSSTIGWTYVFGTKTWMNKKFLDKFNEAETFRHIMHEGVHKYGFSHKYRKSTSVPYKVGYASEYAFLEHYSGKHLITATEQLYSLTDHQSLKWSIVS